MPTTATAGRRAGRCSTRRVSGRSYCIRRRSRAGPAPRSWSAISGPIPARSPAAERSRWGCPSPLLCSRSALVTRCMRSRQGVPRPDKRPSSPLAPINPPSRAAILELNAYRTVTNGTRVKTLCNELPRGQAAAGNALVASTASREGALSSASTDRRRRRKSPAAFFVMVKSASSWTYPCGWQPSRARTVAFVRDTPRATAIRFSSARCRRSQRTREAVVPAGLLERDGSGLRYASAARDVPGARESCAAVRRPSAQGAQGAWWQAVARRL
jgi:hypothetical protein